MPNHAQDIIFLLALYREVTLPQSMGQNPLRNKVSLIVFSSFHNYRNSAKADLTLLQQEDDLTTKAYVIGYLIFI